MSMLRKLRHLPASVLDGRFGFANSNGGKITETVTLKEALHHAVKIHCQNVSDYYWADSKDRWMIRDDFPNLAPAWKLAWFDWRRPNLNSVPAYHLRYPGFITPAGDEGALLMAVELQDRPISSVTGERIRWAYRWLTFAEAPGRIIVGSVYLRISESGRAIPQKFKGNLGEYETEIFGAKNLTEEQCQNYAAFVLIQLNVPLLALTFANCSNTRIIKAPTDNSILAREQKGKLQKKEPIDWYVLEIGKTKKLIETVESLRSDELTPDKTGLRRRLHISRGHFKDYREGKGLFGHHKGLYWWDFHTRGSETLGKVTKDYSIG